MAIIVTLIVLVLITSHICFILEEPSSRQMVRVGLNVVRQTIVTVNNIQNHHHHPHLYYRRAWED